MEIRDRIKVVMKVNQLTAASFADALGVQRSSISHIINGRNKPSLDFIQKILEHFPRVDASWLITGKEPVKTAPDNLVDPKSSTDSKTSKKSNPINKLSNTSDKEIDRIVIFYTDRTFEHYDKE